MLGLRHHRGTAIDLFQGEMLHFVCDAMVTFTGEPIGEALISLAGNGPASYLIHASIPIWQEAHQQTSLVKKALLQSLQRTAEQKLRHLAIPALPGYPLSESAFISMQAIQEFCEQPSPPYRISFVLQDSTSYQAYQIALFTSFPEAEGP